MKPSDLSNPILPFFFDISKAYATVWRHDIIKSLKEWPISGNILKFIVNILKHHRFQVLVDNYGNQMKRIKKIEF